MVNQSATVHGPPIMKRLIECSENETRIGSPTCPPTDDAASKGIDHERDEALPVGHIREIRKPEHVWRGYMEVAVHAVERQGAALSDTQVLMGSRRVMPSSPITLISRATVQRAMSKPSRCNFRKTLRTP